MRSIKIQKDIIRSINFNVGQITIGVTHEL